MPASSERHYLDYEIGPHLERDYESMPTHVQDINRIQNHYLETIEQAQLAISQGKPVEISPTTQVDISPTVWNAVRRSIYSIGKEVIEGEGENKTIRVLYPQTDEITPESYTQMIQERGIKHDDGSDLQDHELLATFEALQQFGFIAKDTNEGTNDVYRITKPDPANKPGPHKKGQGKKVVDESGKSKIVEGWGSERGDGRPKSYLNERLDERDNRRKNRLDQARTVGRGILKVTDYLTGKDQGSSTPTAAETKATEDTDNWWTKNRMTTMKLEYEKSELAKAEEPIYGTPPQMDYATMARMQQPSSERISPTAGRAPEEDPEDDTDLSPEEEIALNPEYKDLFDPSRLHTLHRAIQAEARPAFDNELDKLNKEREDKGQPKLTRLPQYKLSPIVSPISEEKTKQYIGKKDVPAEVFEAITVIRLQNEEILKKRNAARRRP